MAPCPSQIPLEPAAALLPSIQPFFFVAMDIYFIKIEGSPFWAVFTCDTIFPLSYLLNIAQVKNMMSNSRILLLTMEVYTETCELWDNKVYRILPHLRWLWVWALSSLLPIFLAEITGVNYCFATVMWQECTRFSRNAQGFAFRPNLVATPLWCC